jgi:hypothetical protein
MYTCKKMTLSCNDKIEKPSAPLQIIYSSLFTVVF